MTILMLIAIKIALPLFENRNQAVLADIQKEKNNLVELSNEVMDMQTRVDQIRDNLQIKNGKILRLGMAEVLSNLEKDSIAGVAVSLYKYEDDKATVTFVSNNFNDIAKQILNFKKSEYFENVNVVSVDGKEKYMTCVIEMSVKK